MSYSSRRSFLSMAATLAGTAIVLQDARSQSLAGTTWDLSWTDKLTGSHKQVFDTESSDALKTVSNWLNAYHDVLGIESAHLNAVIGIAGSGFPINASDALYEKYPIGEEWKIQDPEKNAPAVRNIYLEGGTTPTSKEESVRSLQERGVLFWQCNNALKGVARRLAKKVNRDESEVYDELKAGLNPGVIVVPAHTMMLGLLQEKGFAYEKV